MIGDRLICCDEDMILCITGTLCGGVKEFISFDDITSFRLSVEGDNAQPWCPALEFTYPVGNGRIWNDDKSRELFEGRNNVPDEGDNLYRLSL